MGGRQWGDRLERVRYGGRVRLGIMVDANRIDYKEVGRKRGYV